MHATPAAALVIAAAVALASPAGGQTFATAPNASFALDLDTADGNYSAWECDDIAGLNALRATLAVRRLGGDPKWRPILSLWVERGDEGVALRATSDKAGAPLILHLTHSKAGAILSDEMFLTFLPATDKAEVEIAWTADGHVSAVVKSPQSLAISPTGERHEALLAGPPTQVRVTSSTGEFELKPLVLGHTAP